MPHKKSFSKIRVLYSGTKEVLKYGGIEWYERWSFKEIWRQRGTKTKHVRYISNDHHEGWWEKYPDNNDSKHMHNGYVIEDEPLRARARGKRKRWETRELNSYETLHSIL